MSKYDDALRYHQQALAMSPQNASTLSCIGFIQALQGHLTDAVDMFHKALSLRRDDSFSISMLSYTMEHFMESSVPFKGMLESFEPGFYRPKTPQLILS